jgi:CPA2 family monovalent cation:H+ antiporter-2
LQVLVTTAVFAALFALGGGTWGAALAWGKIAAVSSTAIVLRTLVDRAHIDSVPGRSAFGILLLQDIAVVPMVLSLTVLSSGGGAREVASQLARTLAAAGLVAVFYFLFYHGIPRILMGRGLFADRVLMILLGIILVAGSAWAAHQVGLSPALGAFLAGMLLAESPFAVQIRSDVGALRTLFVTLFFASVRMMADPAWFLGNWAEVLLWLLGVFFGKALIIYAVCRVFKMGHAYALATGIILAQIEELSFVLTTVARQEKVIDHHVASLAVSVAILSIGKSNGPVRPSSLTRKT